MSAASISQSLHVSIFILQALMEMSVNQLFFYTRDRQLSQQKREQFSSTDIHMDSCTHQHSGATVMAAHEFVGTTCSDKKQEYIRLTAVVEREGLTWIATCREMGTATRAGTLEKALSRLREAIETHLATLEDTGGVYRFLANNNVPVFKSRPAGRFRFTVDGMAPGAMAIPLVQELPEHSNPAVLETAAA